MEDIKKCQTEIDAILKKYNLVYNFEVTFPQYNVLPDTLSLALKVISKETIQVIPTLSKKKEVSAS